MAREIAISRAIRCDREFKRWLASPAARSWFPLCVIRDFLAALPRIELRLVLKFHPAGLLECRFSGRMDGEPSGTLPMKMALQFR